MDINNKNKGRCKYRVMQTAMATSLLLGLAACGGGGGSSDQGVVSADFDKEVYSHRFWSDLSPQQQAANDYVDTSDSYQEIVGIDEYSCTNENYSMTETPEEFVAIDPDLSVLWLGNLIQGNSHLQLGSLAELSIRERAPMVISINLLRENNTRTVAKPSLGSVNSAIGELVDDAVKDGHEAASDARYVSREAHSTEQTSLQLGFTAEYLGSSASASLEVEKQAEENTFFAYFIQNAFTASIELPDAPHSMVNEDLAQSQLDDLKARGVIGESNPPLYISSISYGRVLIYKITSSHSRERIRAAISASYDGLADIGGYAKSDLEETLTTANIEIAAFGGHQSSIESLIRAGELKGYFSGDTKLTSMRPISFEIRNLQDNSIAQISRTTEYSVKKCTHVGKTVKPVGERIKIILDKAHIASDCDAGVDKGDIFGRFDVISFDPANNAKITRRMHTINRSDAVKVQSGNDMKIGSSYTVNKYYGKPFEISAQLKDADGGANGADDLVGNWNANQFSIAGKVPGTYTKKAVGNCSGNNPTLYYRIEREDYLY